MTRRNRLTPCLVLTVLVATFVGGCASPPSVVPLLEQTQRVLREERRLLAADAERSEAWFDQQRSALAAAFEADLAARDALNAEWVRTGVTAYVAAREALVEQETQLARQRQVRMQNLDLASLAQRRAIALIQQQDDLLSWTPDLRQWIDAEHSNSFQEPSHDRPFPSR
jgi:hypothetical protein